MRVSELMHSEVTSVRQDDVVQIAAQKMRDLNTGFLAVCDYERRVAGVVTDRDIVVRVVAYDRPPSTHRLYEIMTTTVVAVRPDEDVETAERLMAEHRVARLPVVDFEGQLLGVVSLADVARRKSGGEARETLKKITTRPPPAETHH